MAITRSSLDILTIKQGETMKTKTITKTLLPGLTITIALDETNQQAKIEFQGTVTFENPKNFLEIDDYSITIDNALTHLINIR